MQPNSTNPLLVSKPRYDILDGLRGVAAMIVVAFHLFETYSPGPRGQVLNHGYLAVDFFFLLSGFVIGYAYDDRWGKMTHWDFFKRRLIRLHPMLIMGTLIGAIFFYFGGAPAFDLVLQTPWWKLLLVTLLGCLMIPLIPAWDIRGWREINPLNGASWSLMWEYIANILYGFVIRHFSRTLLTIFVFLSAFLTIDICFNLDVFNLLSPRDYASYTLIGGFGLSADQIYIGIARLFYPFFLGLLLSRFGCKIKVAHGGFWWCSALIAAVLVMPYLGSPSHLWIDGGYNALSVLLLFPVIVVMGAGSAITDKRTKKVCEFLGALSYPLYITHYPLVYVQMTWAAQNADLPASVHIWVAVSLFILAIGIAYATMKLYDIPVRDWLKKKFLTKKLPYPVKERSF